MTCSVIDTNVLVSALMSRHGDSATVRVMNAVFDGVIVPLYTPAITSEYREVLHRPRLGLDPRKCDHILSYIEDFGIPLSAEPCDICFPDEDDRVFYELALAGRRFGASLVTGNARHYPAAPFVLSPAEFCEVLGI